MSMELRDLRVQRGGTEVLRADLAVRRGCLTGLIGPNGAGKSTLMRAALGLLPATGRVTIDGAPLDALSAAARARLLAWLPQDRVIAWPLPVAEVVALGRLPLRGPFMGPGPADRAAVAAAMRRMGVAGMAERPADRLSGGEAARVLIARALAQETPWLLADEPIAGLDPGHAIALMRHFRALADEGRGVMVSIHDLGLAARWCQRLVLLEAGRVVAEGPPAEVLTPELLARVYGIRARIEQRPRGLSVEPEDTV